ncbi:MAG TPA: hypothetical protein GXZ74_06890 [Tissierellia bacterium]|nr:hypothetical protein [Tissierellia bacterium]
MKKTIFTIGLLLILLLANFSSLSYAIREGDIPIIYGQNTAPISQEIPQEL